jgi:2-oxoglutarate dehydrogenase E2 component (dihydrolipoamide succinyltransferase)
MALEMKVPSPGESISEVEIAEWLVSDGDYVEKDQTIAEVDSDKATLELPAEAAGIVTLKAEEGDVVEVGEVVCLIDTDAEQPADEADNKETEDKSDEADKEAPKAEEQPKTEEPKAEEQSEPAADKTYASGTPSPAAKKILDEKNVPSSDVKGSGRDGRITKDDAVKAEGKASMGTPGPGKRGTSTKKMSMLRRRVAQRLVDAKNETAMLTTFNEVDMKPIFDLRKEYKDTFKEKHGVSLGFMSFFTLAVIKALDEFPAVNSMIDGDHMITYEYKDISIAVSGPKGLMVPVIRNAENYSFRGIEAEVKRLATRARDGQITVDEMTGGTFTISNGGVFGSMLSTPIINPPQSGILGMHNIVERPMAIDGKVEIRPMMYVALSYDHRIIDGKESVGFLVKVKECLEDPLNELMEGDARQALEL